MKAKPILGILMSLGFVFLSFTNAVNPEAEVKKDKEKGKKISQKSTDVFKRRNS